MELQMCRGTNYPYTDEELSQTTRVALQSPMWGPFSGTMNIFIERARLANFISGWNNPDNLSNKEYSMDIHIEPNWACPSSPLIKIDCRCHLRQSCAPLLNWLSLWGEFYWEPEEQSNPHVESCLWLRADGSVIRYEFNDSEGG